MGDFLLKVPLLAVGPTAQGAQLIGAQGAARAVAGDVHLLVEHVGQANAVDSIAGGAVTDVFAVDGDVGVTYASCRIYLTSIKLYANIVMGGGQNRS